MKKIFYLLAGILSLCLSLVLIVLLVFFVEPTIIVNSRNISWGLRQSQVLEYWSWKKMDINHDWMKWNERKLTGEIRDFCFRYNKGGTKASTCFSEISWDFDLLFNFQDMFSTRTRKPFLVHSPKIEATLAKTPETNEPPKEIEVYRWWSLFWSGVVPDMDVNLDSIKITKEGKTNELDFHLSKRARTLTASVKEIKLTADPESFEVKGPPAIELPEKIKTMGPFYFRNLSLKGKVTRKEIPLHFTGALEEAVMDVTAKLDLPLPADVSGADFRRNFLSTVAGEVKIPGFREAYRKRAPAAFRELPAPLNVMDGVIILKFGIKKGKKKEDVRFQSVTNINLSSSREALHLDISADSDIPVMVMKPDSIEIGLNFHEVKLELPKLSKKAPPPQFLPDKRFRKGPWVPPENKAPETDVNVHLTALNRKSLHIATNLLDEPLRLNFDLLIGNGKVNKGHVTALPLKTEIFKRPVRLRKMVITFDAPLEPVIEAEILFPLPEYKVTLNLEGPVSKPRYAFKSDPPLPQNDIFAVLLFGRPLQELDPDDKTAAQKTNQILAQGILSLSVLYFLAGSPVEYVGFDPDSQNATAQFGLTKKTSLRVGGGQEGMNSGGLRHSLGKGWYIDTTVQNNNNRTTDDQKNYGVLLERVIAY